MRSPCFQAGVLALGLIVGLASQASAQLAARTVAAGLDRPVGFVPDPELRDTQYVVEQGGRIRVLYDGQLLETDFLDLREAIADSTGERGLLGLAFAPDYADSHRFFVYFTDQEGGAVLARFSRSSDDPRVADRDSRFDLRWPDGRRAIFGDHQGHFGGQLEFGKDGYLYIGLGDRGERDDPAHLAQDPASLLGKMLRLDVSVPDADEAGYQVPADNPFVGVDGFLGEIWAFGLRNPWRFSLDSFGDESTGAMFIGDVGQEGFEEVNFSPAGRGGRNYGWRNHEGSQPYITEPGPAFEPLVDPLHEYGHETGRSVIGGRVYRGAALTPAYRGRYFFADFVMARVWSMGVAIDDTGEAAVTEIQEHTSELRQTVQLGNVSSFGIDADGEIYLVDYSRGEIHRIVDGTPPRTRPLIAFDAPDTTVISLPLVLHGWAVDLEAATPPGVDVVHVWAMPADGSAGIFVGVAEVDPRADLVAAFGPGYETAGYRITLDGLAPGSYQVLASAHSVISNQFFSSSPVAITVPGPSASPTPDVVIEQPAADATVLPRFTISGWAADRSSPIGTGIDAIHVWARSADGSRTFLGVATYGLPRSDIGGQYGERFAPSGWSLDARGLTPGNWTIEVFAHSVVTQSFAAVTSVTIAVGRSVYQAMDVPQPGPVPGTFTVSGWAVDLVATSDAGVAAIHVWAFPVDSDEAGGGGTFVGWAVPNRSRPDLGSILGSQFTVSGYELTGSLPAGTYDLVAFAQSNVTGTFDNAIVVRVAVQAAP